MSAPNIAAKIANLKKLADHPNTPHHEAEAARGRIKALQEKHGINPTKPSPKYGDPNKQFFDDMERRSRETADAMRRMADAMKKAAEADDRSRAQKQQDMDDRWKRSGPIPKAGYRKTQTPTPGDIYTHCPNPESFFDPGGIPRKRNEHVIDCDKCGSRLKPGEGTVFQVGGVWYGRCAETVPGPRRKKKWAT